MEDFTTKPSLPLAGFAVRWLALAIENFVAMGVSFFILATWYDLHHTGYLILVRLDLAGRVLLWLLVWLIFTLLYYVPSWTFFGASPAGRLLGLRIVQRDASPIGFGKAISRFLGSIGSALLFGVGYLWAAFDPQKQTWHDQIASTYVVSEKHIRQPLVILLALVLSVLQCVLFLFGMLLLLLAGETFFY